MADPELTLELERAALRAAMACYYQFNAVYFQQKLSKVSLFFTNSTHYLGRYSRSSRSIELSRQLLLKNSWAELLEVLKHEMAHQYVAEVLGVEESAHGPAFQKLCTGLGIDSRATGMPKATEVVPEAARMLERVAKLLALAQSKNQHEAEAATLAAQRLMLKYNIDQSRATEARGYVYRHLGQPLGRISEAQRTLGLILTQHFFVEGIWVGVWRPLEGKRGSVFEICGTAANVELAEYVHGYLSTQAEHLFREHKQRFNTKGQAERQRYLAGVMSGFLEKLDGQKKQQRETGLIWLGDPELRRYLKQRHPHTRTTYFGSGHHGESYAHGKRAGLELVLRRGIESGPSGSVLSLKGKSS